MKQAILPEECLEKLIEDLEVGESGFTVPWAMQIDEDRKCWMNEDYSIHDQAGGTVDMQVTRTKDGFIVDISQCSYQWETALYNLAGGCKPVVELVTKNE